MAIVALILLGIFWMYVTAYHWDRGENLRSRGSLRYQRRKARRLGVNADQVAVEPRNAGAQIPEPRHHTHVEGVNRLLASTLLWLVGVPVIAISITMVAYGVDGGWPLAILILASAAWLIYRRQA